MLTLDGKISKKEITANVRLPLVSWISNKQIKSMLCYAGSYSELANGAQTRHKPTIIIKIEYSTETTFIAIATSVRVK